VVTSSAELQDSWMRSQQLLGNEVGSLLLLDAVSAVQVEFFRGNSWTNAQSSGDLQPASPGGAPQREQPPTGLRLVLSFGEERLVRDLMLPPQMP
jgi:general secretion pathway protein J